MKTNIPSFFLVVLLSVLIISCTTTALEANDVPPETDFIDVVNPKNEDVPFDFFKQSVQFDVIDVFSGLSSNVVNEVIQDQYGLIWIATFDGLIRYDGKNFTIFKKDASDPNSLINDAVWTIYQDRDGYLWVGTDGGLDQFDRASQSFIHYQSDPLVAGSISSNYVRSILQDSGGYLWIGTSGGGLCKYDYESEEFETFTHDDNSNYSIASNIVRSIYEDSRGYLWVGTWNGLDRFDYETGSFFHFNQEIDENFNLYLENLHRGIKGIDINTEILGTADIQYDPSNISTGNKIVDIDEDLDGDLWLATLGGGVSKFDPFNGSFVNYQNDIEQSASLSNNTVLDVFRDSQNNYWFGTNDGLNLYDRKNDRFVRFMADQNYQDVPNTLSNGMVTAIMEDRSGMYWVSTSGGGINIFSPSMNRFQHVKNDPSRPSSLSDNTVWAFHHDYDGTLWVANNAGVDIMREGASYFIHYDPHAENLRNEDDAVYAFLRDSTGKMWIGTAHGLSVFNYAENRFVSYLSDQPIFPQVLLGEVVVTSLEEDSIGNIWIGTYGQGLVKLDQMESSLIPYTYDPQNSNSISSNLINVILPDQGGYIWIGTIGGGLNYYDPNTATFVNYLNQTENPASISDNNITSLNKSPDGLLWIGTYAGLNVYDPDTNNFKSYTVRDGLSSDTILGVVIDNEGIVWVSTGNGLSRFDPESETFINFTYRDGLQSAEFISGSCALGNGGIVFFGGMDGYNLFYPQQLGGNTYIPEIVLTSLTHSGELVELEQGFEEVEEIALKAPDNYFEFEFSSMNYVQPHKNEYAYILEGFDKDWNYVGTRSYGRYTNLDPGEYLLRLIGSNNDGVWNTAGKTIQIRVIPAWWESQWFRVSAILLIALASISFYRLQIGNVERYNRRLSAEVQERTRDIEKRRRVSEGLREILIRLNSNLPIRESIDYIACQVSTLLSAPCVLIVQLRGDNRVKTLAVYIDEHCNGETGSIPAEFGEVPSAVVAQISSTIKKQKQVTVEFPDVETGIQQIYTGVPIFLSGDVYGGLIIEHGDLEIRHEELELLKSFADQVGLAIGNELLRTEAEEIAVVSERNRIARDLHDAITQTLFSANLIAETITELWDTDRSRSLQLITELRQLNQSALAEMRTLLLELKPASVIETDMEELLNQLANVLRGRAGCEVELDIQGHCSLPEEVHIGVYRIAQEAITNIMKHASATQVRIQLICEVKKANKKEKSTHLLHLVIEDNGSGFSPELLTGSRFGLANMQQRAHAINAQLDVETRIEQGTTIHVIWQEREDDEANGRQNKSNFS
ncbi:MAG TPA: hypothetical protein DCK95_09920 [Anaerolineaceae bacterium]|uniref:Histidine kinase n=1 Tax=Anaerolinea thermophila TaxID=167964 RepID=A0A117LGT5_9CHLR|nr:MAG: Histidine kinase [Anaerolinea thermophila]HAF62626.1 hypothetical protein [Anaerolineaceae bacterium]